MRNKDHKHGLIDKNGSVCVPAVYDEVGAVSEGLISVSNGKLWGYVDKSGKDVIALKFKYARPFSEGLAAAFDGKAWGFIDKQGSWVLKPQYKGAQDFHEGCAVVTLMETPQKSGKKRRHFGSRTII